MNPRSGPDTPSVPELVAAAERRGIETTTLGPGDDAGELAREAAQRGAATVGVASGDGTLGSVASVALERDLPFVCIPFGTRNHFARDLGLDCDDPLPALAAFEGRERHIDVGTVDGHTFLNNVSLGIYGSFVHDPSRKTKNRVLAAARLIPAAVGRSRTPLDVSFESDGRRVAHRALVVLVGNNRYDIKALAGGGGRERLDEGRLHAYVVEATTRTRLLGLLARATVGRHERADEWNEWAADSFRVETERRRFHAALDGEPVTLEPPLEFAVRARALRVLVPAR